MARDTESGRRTIYYSARRAEKTGATTGCSSNGGAVQLARRQYLRIARAVALAALVVLAFGGIPGARLQGIGPAGATMSTCGKGAGGDVEIEVTIRESADGSPVAAAYVRVLSVTNDRAFLI